MDSGTYHSGHRTMPIPSSQASSKIQTTGSRRHTQQDMAFGHQWGSHGAGPNRLHPGMTIDRHHYLTANTRSFHLEMEPESDVHCPIFLPCHVPNQDSNSRRPGALEIKGAEQMLFLHLARYPWKMLDIGQAPTPWAAKSRILCLLLPGA